MCPVPHEKGGRTGGTARGRRLIEALEAAYPDAGITLEFGSPFELLVATVLAAQCTDERVNGVTERLFTRYRLPRDYYRVPAEQLEEEIRPTGFFRNKAKALQALSRAIDERHGGEVPDDLDALVALPGVGRKTANVILGNAFGRAALAVDTHVRRVSARLGLTAESNPDKVEADLRKIIPRGKWALSTHLLIFHGRRCCRARRPACGRCPLYRGCRFEEKRCYAARS